MTVRKVIKCFETYIKKSEKDGTEVPFKEPIQDSISTLNEKQEDKHGKTD